MDYGDLASFLVEQSIAKRDGRVGLNATASTTGIESISPRPAMMPVPQPMPEVHVVPGSADRAAARIVGETDVVRPQVEPAGMAVAAATTTAATRAVPAAQPVAIVDPPRIFTPPRAADLVARAQKLHGRGGEGETGGSGGGGPGGSFGAATQLPPEQPPAKTESASKTEQIAPRDTGVNAAVLAEDPDAVWYGVRVLARGVVFRQPLTLGRNVRIAGEFNNWSDVATPLRPHPTLGVLEGVAKISPGSTQYRLVVDTQWIADPYNPLVAPNPFGGANSILFVPEFDTASAASIAATPSGGRS